MQETQVWSLCGEDPLEKGMATHFSIFAWRIPVDRGAWWAAVHGVAKSQTRLSNFPFTFHFHELEKEMATHSSVLAWRIPGTGEPGRLLSMGSHRVGHDWSDLAAAAAAWEQNCFYLVPELLQDVLANWHSKLLAAPLWATWFVTNVYESLAVLQIF